MRELVQPRPPPANPLYTTAEVEVIYYHLQLVLSLILQASSSLSLSQSSSWCLPSPLLRGTINQNLLFETERFLCSLALSAHIYTPLLGHNDAVFLSAGLVSNKSEIFNIFQFRNNVFLFQNYSLHFVRIYLLLYVNVTAFGRDLQVYKFDYYYEKKVLEFTCAI